MYFSEKRKQGLGSLRPGYNIGSLVTGNLINYAAPKLFDYAFKSKEQRQKEKLERDMRKLGIYGYFPEGSNREEDDDTNKTSGFKGALGGGLMNLLATALFGPLAGPLVLRAGRGLMNRRNQMSLMPSGDPSNIGPQSGKVTTLDGKTVDFGSDDYVADMKARDKAFQETGDYDVYADTPTSSPTYSPPDPSTYTYEGSDEQDEASNYGGGNMSASDFSDDSPGTPFFKGGRVSYSKGGIASLWQR
jgi:hypothetical protein